MPDMERSVIADPAQEKSSVGRRTRRDGAEAVGHGIEDQPRRSERPRPGVEVDGHDIVPDAIGQRVRIGRCVRAPVRQAKRGGGDLRMM